jgi:hypothetical protein
LAIKIWKIEADSVIAIGTQNGFKPENQPFHFDVRHRRVAGEKIAGGVKAGAAFAVLAQGAERVFLATRK